jgi:hypothetical protein
MRGVAARASKVAVLSVTERKVEVYIRATAVLEAIVVPTRVCCTDTGVIICYIIQYWEVRICAFLTAALAGDIH